MSAKPIAIEGEPRALRLTDAQFRRVVATRAEGYTWPQIWAAWPFDVGYKTARTLRMAVQRWAKKNGVVV